MASNIVSLTPEQEEAAKELLSEENIHLSDLGVDFQVIDEVVPAGKPYEDCVISASDVVYNIKELSFQPQRIRKILNWMLDGKYDLTHDELKFRPEVIPYNGKYAVTGDGTHRILTHRFLYQADASNGIDDIAVEKATPVSE